MNPETEDRLFYYCTDGETVEGPHAWEQLLELLGDGVISLATAICEAGRDEWTTLGQLLPSDDPDHADPLAVVGEAPAPSVDPEPAPAAVRPKASRMTPYQWAAVTGAVAAVATLAYAGIRFMPRPEEKPPEVKSEVKPPVADPEPDIAELQRLALQGDISAQYRLGNAYRDGKGVAQDKEKAAEWYRKAAEGGSAEADVALGDFYCSGFTAAKPVHWDKAAAVWKEQAEKGSIDAQLKIGNTCYRNGFGVPRDGAKAIYWLEKAAAQNHANSPIAMWALGRMYSGDRDIPRDDAKAFYWTEKSALLGHAWTDVWVELKLAQMYESGQGTKRDLKKAQEWAQKAAARGNKEAKDLLAKLESIPDTVSESFEIDVAGSKVIVDRMGQGSVGVIFFGHSGSKEMKYAVLADAASFAGLLPDKCSFFLWEYPQSPPFDQIQKAISSYMQGDKEKIRPDFSGIAGQVLSQIRDKTGLTEFLLVGNSLGAGIVLWDYKNLSADPKVRFLLISPTEAFMPPVSSLGNLERTMLLSATGIEGNPSKTDGFLKGQEAWDWVNERIDRDATEKITASQPEGPRNFGYGHKTIGNDIDSGLLSKLIKVNLGLAERAMLSEPLPVVATPLAMPVKFDIGREAVELPAGTEVQVLRRERNKALIQAHVTNSGGTPFLLRRMVDSASLAPTAEAKTDVAVMPTPPLAKLAPTPAASPSPSGNP